jgi:hypothetical protein
MADEQDVVEAPEAGAAIDHEQAAAELLADPGLDVEAIAREFGWSPKEAWRGDPAEWSSAGDFLKGAAKIHKRTREDLKAVRKSNERIGRMVETIAQERLQKLKDDWEARLDEAVEAGDKVGARKAQAEINRITQEAEASASNPEAEFAEANPWYGKDEDATALAVGVSQRLAAQGKTVAEQLEAAAAKVRERFPELFGDDDGEPEPAPTRRKAPPSVHAPGSRGGSTARGGRGWNDIPMQDRATMEREFVAKGLVTDKGELARIYFEENGQ